MRLAIASADQHNANGSSLLGTILVLASLDEFIVNDVASHREDGKHSVGGCR